MALAGYFWWTRSLLPSQPKSSESKIIVIVPGQSLDEIIQQLDQAGLIKNPFAFKLLVMQKNLATRIQAGDFRLSPGMTAQEIAETLTKGTLDVWVTFLEGWRSEQFLAALVQKGFEIDSQAWQKQINQQNLEGKLFPDTYLIPKQASQEQIIQMLINNFERRLEVNKLTSVPAGMNFSQVMILASIVEREMRSPQDKPIVAGILIKRWQADWPLQADATVQYLLGSRACSPGDLDCQWWPSQITRQDLKINSPYNTYLSLGLPPAPICNPGLGSIQAVINYQESPYWFYLSDLSGQTRFAQTLEEHNQNVARYLGK